MTIWISREGGRERGEGREREERREEKRRKEREEKRSSNIELNFLKCRSDPGLSTNCPF